MTEAKKPELKLLSFDDVVAADDLEVITVDVPEWGGSVRLRALTGAERDAYESDVTQTRGRDVQVNFKNLRAKLVARCLIDEEGNLPFNSKQGIEALGKKNASVLVRLFDKCRKLSGMTEEDVEELAGNSEPVQSDDSTSD